MSFRLRSLAVALGFALLALPQCARRHGSESTGSNVGGGNATSTNSAPQAGEHPGKALYDRYCRLCHAADGTGYAADNAPSLVSQTFLESATDAFIAQAIRVGRSNSAMGAYGKERGGPLDDGSINTLVAYLRTKGPKQIALPHVPVTGDIGRGAQLYEKNCRTCHGSPGARGTALLLENPELLGSASPDFLRHAIRHGRPPTSMPAFEGKLAPSEIEDLLAWLQSRSPAGPAPRVINTTVPDNLPVVINPKGKPPQFTLRDGRFVAAVDVKRALDEKRRMVIVDARSPADWIQFHIPGAISVAYHDPNHLDRIPNDGTWVIAYCACPHHASGEVVDRLRARKYPNTAVLDEGILVWKDRGYPIAGEAAPKGAPSPQPSSAKPAAKPQPGSVKPQPGSAKPAAPGSAKPAAPKPAPAAP